MGKHNAIDWTDKDADLRRLFPNTDNANIAETLGVSVAAVRSRAQLLGLRKDGRYWGKKDEKKLVKQYPLVGFQELAAMFPGKTRWAIINKYRSLTGLRVDNGGK